ncbi:DUF1631 family protein [Viridibacterium curvum]|uniref:DUF1631 family protein n=1 Tax=Viridibacterium curvum TaxID=1101404 RepID=A0ABP9Q9Z0_9RHOO
MTGLSSPSASITAHALDESRRALLDTLGGLLRDFKYQDSDVIAATLNAAGEQFDILVGLKDRKSFDAQRSLTASRISLVHEEDLEFSIRLADLSQQLRERCEQALGQLHLRFMTLLDQSEAAPEQLPVGPETIGCALRALASEAGLNPDARIRMLQDMRSELGRRLKALYELLNKRLGELGIEPRSLLRSNERNPALDSAQRRATSAAVAAPARSIDPMLADALRDRMLAWLEDQLKAGDRDSITRQLSSTELATLLPEDTRQAVDLVERALQRVLASDLPAAAKTALDTLRIPMLKVALRDTTLATDAAHPARALLEQLTRMAAELPANVGAHDTRVQQLASVCAQVAGNYQEDLEAFAQPLTALTKEHDNKTALVATQLQAASETIAREERNELARRNASNAIRALCSPEPPVTVRLFLEHYWSVVLRRALLTAGEKSDAWRDALKLADMLIWSMQPKIDTAEREKLVRVLPDMLRGLQGGLDSLHVSPEARDRLLARFTTLHTEALKGRDPRGVEPAVAPPPEEPARLDPAMGQPELKILRRPGFLPAEPSPPASLANLSVGEIVQLALPGEVSFRGSIVAFSQFRNVILLRELDKDSLLAVAWTELLRQHQSGSLQLTLIPEVFAD